MKTKLRRFLCILSFVALTGCTTANPHYNPSLPMSPDNQPTIADNPRIEKAFNFANGLVDQTAPFNPYADVIKMILGSVAGLVTVGSVGYARYQSRHKKAAAVLAKTVVAGGATQIHLANNSSPDPKTAATVAQHIFTQS